MTVSIQASGPQSLQTCQASLARRRSRWSFKHPLGMEIRRVMILLLVTAFLPAAKAWSQSPSDARYLSTYAGGATSGTLDPLYMRPQPSKMLRSFTFDAFGPYALTSTALIAGLDQATNTPPEWQQGFVGYSERFGSDFGIALVGTTTRYGLAAVLKQDTSFYPCTCRGFFPRLRHAAISTLTARRGEDGHRVFSIPALVAPYAGATVAVYGWYPNRYSAKDAFRMGNYSLLESVGGNIALEFLYSGPHSLFSRIHFRKTLGTRFRSSTQ